MNMKIILCLLLALSVTCTCSSQNQEQITAERKMLQRQLGAGLGFWFWRENNLLIPDVTPEQQKQFKTASARYRRAIREPVAPQRRIRVGEDLEAESRLDEQEEAEFDEYYKLLEQIENEYHTTLFNKLTKKQKHRLVQVALQADGAARWPFYYCKKEPFLESAGFTKQEQTAFIEYLKQNHWLGFDKRVDKLVKRHRADVLKVLSKETRQRLLKLVGEQGPTTIIPVFRQTIIFNFRDVKELDAQLFKEVMDEKTYQSWSRLLINEAVVSELDWLDEQHNKHLALLQKCYREGIRIPEPTGEKFQVGPNTWRFLIDQADVDAYAAKLNANYTKYHEERLELLLPHQKQRLFQLVRQRKQMEYSVFGYLRDEHLLKKAKATALEKRKIRLAIKEQTQKLNESVQLLVKQQTDAIYRKIPNQKRTQLKKKFGKPLEFVAISKLAHGTYFLDRKKDQELFDAMSNLKR